MVVCAGNNEIISYATPIGVGLVESSIGLTRLCMKEYVENLVFIGSAGAYSYDLPLLTVCVSSRATQIESSLITGASYTPLDNVIELEMGKSVSRETLRKSSGNIIGSHDVVVNSSNYITLDSVVATQMSQAGIAIENMEFFSVLAVAREFGIPAFGVFCITNYCDKNARTDFMRNHTKAKEILAEFIAGLTSKDKREENKPIGGV